VIVHDAFRLELDFFAQQPVRIEPLQEQLSSDAGLLLFRQLDEQVSFTAGFAAQLEDSRRAPEHSPLEMVRSRLYGVLAGYEDQNDHDALRGDAVFKLLAGRSPNDDDLASQPTLSRFENSVSPGSLLRLEEWFLQRFVSIFESAPKRLTLDIDVLDDPAHGDQQLTLFHGYYGQYQYLVRAITCAENDLVVLPALLHGTAHATLGAAVEIERVVTAIRQRFADLPIHLRGDSGYAAPAMYEACERLRVEYTIGIGMNAVLRRNSEELLQQAVACYEQTGQPQRLFTGFYYQAGSWPAPRFVVVKCEAHAQGTNRRAVVTNRPGAAVLPQGVYEEYAARGESENRNKELKCGLAIDRLSDHRYMANCFRMFLHCGAYNLLTHMRHRIAAPPPNAGELPPEAQTGRDRRRQFNRRRAADPLGEGHACTWRTMLIKVAARIKVTARCVRIFLSGSWPYLPYFRAVGERLLSG